MTFDDDVKKLYGDLLAAWNRRDASGMARLYAADGLQIGFDGSICRERPARSRRNAPRR